MRHWLKRAWSWLKSMWTRFTAPPPPLDERVRIVVDRVDNSLTINDLVDIVESMMERGVGKVGELNVQAI